MLDEFTRLRLHGFPPPSYLCVNPPIIYWMMADNRDDLVLALSNKNKTNIFIALSRTIHILMLDIYAHIRAVLVL